VTFATAAPLQAAIAEALRLPDAYFDGLRASYLRRRDWLVRALAAAGLVPQAPEGAYFVMADTRATGFADDVAFCRHLTTEAGVAAIPPSAFYSAPHKREAAHLARFAFCKSDAVLAAAEERLLRFGELRKA
jgi:N-succinyldiaminopimelate aminotransferase